MRGPKPWGRNIETSDGHSTDLITDRTMAWLGSRTSDAPFFLMHHYNAPHDMFDYAPRYEDYLAGVTIPEPVDLYRVPDTFGPVATRGVNDSLRGEIGTSVSKRNARRNMGIHMHVNPGMSDRDYTRVSYQRYLKAFLRCVKRIDDTLARLFGYLRQNGLWDNTVIICTADQGFMLGEHDFIDKRWIFDPSMRMPLFVRHPYIQSPATSDLLINNTDYGPFLLETAGASVPGSMQGRSFAPALRGETPRDWRQATHYRYWMHRAHHDVPAHFGVRTATHKLIFFYGTHYLTDPPPSFGIHS